MQFNSLQYIAFFLIVTAAYYILPHRFGLRNVMLLAANYYFYMQWNVKYAVLMLVSTSITFAASLAIDVCREKGKRGAMKFWLAACIISNLAILFFFKYYGFAAEVSRDLAELLNMNFALPVIRVLLPVGISFYTFQALGYTIDVYRGDTKVVTNPIKYALFVSFFPQLVAGPIERSYDLLAQFDDKHTIKRENLGTGAFLILWGLFKKMVIADRAGAIVAAVYDSYESYSGGMYVIATICFAFQVYCDFSAYSDIACGSANILGFKLTRNFRSPYVSESVSEFWRRWHTSLSFWFRDYIYIPLGGNRKGRVRKYINLLVVFFVSGLWHGAGFCFIIWGLLNGVFQVIGDLLKPVREKINVLLGNTPEKGSYRLFRKLFTFALICITWVFFRAETLTQATDMLKEMFFLPAWSLTDGTLLTAELATSEIMVLIGSVAILIAADAKFAGDETIEMAYIRQPVVFRYGILAALYMLVILLGIYGSSYDPQDFIYFEF